MSNPSCFHPMCNKSLPEHTLFRMNAKGVEGIWACWEHKKNTDAKPDPELERIVMAIEGRL